MIKFRNNKLKTRFTTYTDGNLALLLLTEDNEPYTKATVNLDEPLTDKYCAFIDTNNNGDEILEAIKDLGELTGNIGESGYCEYPEFRFHKDIIESEY